MTDEATGIECPHCGLKGKTKRPPKDGTTIHCPSCRGEFVHREAVFTPAPRKRSVFAKIAAYVMGAAAVFHTIGFVMLASEGKNGGSISEFVNSLFSLAFVMLIAAAVLGAFPMLGVYVARQKGRSTTEGAWFGFLLGPFGVLIELLLPTVEAKK